MLSTIALILMCQVAAPWLALDFPSLRGLHVTSVKRWPRLEPRTGVHGLPERLVISGVHTNGKFSLTINLEGGGCSASSWTSLTGQSSNSGDIGVILIGSPSLLLTAPLWLTTGLVYALLKVITGMDHHFFAMYLKLQGQLEPGDAKLLKQSLQVQSRT